MTVLYAPLDLVHDAERLLAADGPATGALLPALREGVPYVALAAVAEAGGVELAALARVLAIPPRTLARRKAVGKLSPTESDRLFRVARVIAQARITLGDADRARAWLQRPNTGLGGVVPLTLLDTDLGARQVDEVLLRLTHGVFG